MISPQHLTSEPLKSGGQRYKVKEVIQHEQYNKPPFANDIGLVRINGKIEFNDKVQPIKYSKKFVEGGKSENPLLFLFVNIILNIFNNSQSVGTKLSTTGWGRIRVSFYARLHPIGRK